MNDQERMRQRAEKHAEFWNRQMKPKKEIESAEPTVAVPDSGAVVNGAGDVDLVFFTDAQGS